ncbi:MAG TPA: toxin-antitoxin system HicB family antitoxin [Propionibacteriaceae bacterium]|nr:toxin-antitoxin system HicB family antitoxin [Propionibacteriaceae bacterium]
MQLTPYLAAVAEDLDRSTQLADEATRDVARRLVTVLEPGLRLAMVQLLSDAAAQLTADLSGPVVTIRMEGREPVWHVVSPEAEPAAHTTMEPDGDDAGQARVTVRLPEAVKRRAEAAAQAAGQSLNTWIIQTLRRATSSGSTAKNSSRRITGWA